MTMKPSNQASAKMELAFNAAQQKLAEAAKVPHGMNESTAQALWREGFLPDKMRLYDLKEHSLQSYLSDVQREMTKFLNGQHSAVLNNKLLFEAFFGRVAATAKTVFHTSRGSRNYLRPREELRKVAATYYAKPLSSGGGTGVVRCDVRGGQVLTKQGEQDWEAFENWLVSQPADYILTEAVAQHPLLARIYPGSTNTIRILMMRDPETGDGFVPSAVLRVGTSNSAGVDNFSRGGISFELDIQTGRVGRGAMKRGNLSERIEVHPDTGVQITGTTIPFWDDTMRAVRDAFDSYRPLIYVGWDVIISGTGPVLLEGNNYSDVHLLQVHRPLLDPRTRRFYEEAGLGRWRLTTVVLPQTSPTK